MHDKCHRLHVQWTACWGWIVNLFETCRGYYWNKFKKKVHLVGSYYANLSRCTVHIMSNNYLWLKAASLYYYYNGLDQFKIIYILQLLKLCNIIAIFLQFSAIREDGSQAEIFPIVNNHFVERGAWSVSCRIIWV